MSISDEILKNVIQKKENIQISDNYDDYNILSILGKETDEVVMCKILWSVLNRKVDGKRKYLFGFIREVLQLDYNSEILEKALIYREYLIPINHRRIDLAIKIPGGFIPIEAKIYAGDQWQQCNDYLSYSSDYFENKNDAVLYYLTLDGHQPSTYSLSGDKSLLHKVKILTWKGILEWLEVLSSEEEVISQYCKALRILIDEKRGEIEMFTDELLNSSDAISAAFEIEKSLSRKKTELLNCIFEEIIDKVSSETKLEYDAHINEDGDYNFKRRVSEYYKHKKSSWPGIMYKVKLIRMEDGSEYYLVIRFEIEDRPYVFFGIAKKVDSFISEENKPSSELLKKIKEAVSIPEKITYNKNWLLYWEYVTSNGQEITETEPDFSGINDAYLSLFNENQREEFVNQTVETIKKFSQFIK